nr:Bm243 [Brugia malayi]
MIFDLRRDVENFEISNVLLSLCKYFIYIILEESNEVKSDYELINL